jgi:alkylation response protein AidB-like acyl-CoA dehydrogenase
VTAVPETTETTEPATLFRHPPMLAFEALEEHLGSPEPLRAETARLDEDEAFPAGTVAALTSFGLHRYYVPAEYGGLLRDYESAAALVRAVAGRDLTAAIAHGKTFLGSVCVWVAGDERQARRLASDVSKGMAVAWGLTERAHGSDLLGGELTATPSTDGTGGVRLDGEKWLINNATRGELLCVLARSDPAGGPRGFSLYLADKKRIDPTSFQPLPKVRTIGIRGADISGFRLDGLVVDADDDRVGPAGHGLEIVLKALQLTRTLCPALSLGAGDHALRVAVGFAERRMLYGRRLAELPDAARTLAECYADHLLGEALAVVATRGIQALPGEMSVLSAAVKYLIPVRTEDLIARLRRLLGARAWLCDVAGTDTEGGDIVPGAGDFQKLERDHRIVSLFDGSTVVNLNSLISQFPALIRASRKPRDPAPGFRAAVDLSRDLPALDRGRLRLAVGSGVSLLHSLDGSAGRAAALAAGEPALAPHARAVHRLRDRAEDLLTRLASAVTPPGIPAEAFDQADRLAHVLAGAAATALWLENRAAFGSSGADDCSPWRADSWLLAALDRLEDGEQRDEFGAVFGTDPGYDGKDDDDAARDRAYATLLGALRNQVRSGRLTSLFPARLAGAA